MGFPIAITASALASFEDRYRSSEFSYVRVGVKGGGCSGFSYFISYEDDAGREDDSVFEAGSVSIRIDRKSSKMLEGTTLDYVDNLLNGKEFRFLNPNQKSACGCGYSFDI